ncbi:MAG TPA: site-2 protease family protein [Bdellovibrionales bacterium]|nr:site-2 protease family protein [Bdellovibrionales bacterium]
MFQFEIRADASWFILVALVTASLVLGTFPQFYPGLSTGTYVLMGLIGAIGLFASIVLHELCHSIVGRYFQMPIHEITLFLFGGVAHLEDEPPSAKSEFAMAIAGPVCSVALGFFFGGLHMFGMALGWGGFALGVAAYLMQVNFLLAMFNMIPAFPLDGGRILRALLWGLKRDLRWATRVASAGGQGFGVVLMILGLTQFFVLGSIGGFWLVFLGILLMNVARAAYQQLLVKQALHGRPVSRFMNANPLLAEPAMTVAQLVPRLIHDAEASLIPVVEHGEVQGFVDAASLVNVPPENWERLTVSQIVRPLQPAQVIDPEADAEHAMQRMAQSGARDLIVVRDRKFWGVLTLRGISRFISLRGPRAA